MSEEIVSTLPKFNIEELKPHPRNTEFFDDLTGGKWEELLQSIKVRVAEGKRGNIEPIIITPDKMIVSGHQRVRAFKELGIPTIEAEVKSYNSDDEILQDLIETNIRQRGEVGGSAKKVGARIKELERLYGIKVGGNGSNQHEQIPNNSAIAKSQEDIATLMGISVDTLQNYKKLTEMIPELEDLVDTGIVTKTTALAIMKELKPDEQKELIENMDVTKKITKAKAEAAIEEMKRKHEETLDECKDLQDKLAKSKDQNKLLQNELKEYKDKSPEKQMKQQICDSCFVFASRVAAFLEDVGGYVWLATKINEMSNDERNGYLLSLQMVKDWVNTLEYNINKEKGDTLL